MTSVWDRRNPRISYQVPVGVLDLAEQRLLDMSSINVSQGGMFVGTSEQMAIGSELVCNVPIGRGTDALQIRGRVVWLRPGSMADERRPNGMGIEFLDLSDLEYQRLAEIVGEPGDQSHAVRLQLEGLGGPVSAQARLTPHGIFFRAPLPFLSLDSELDFAFLDEDFDNTYRGRIVGVDVSRDAGSTIPRLQVEVELASTGHHSEALASAIEAAAPIEAGTPAVAAAPIPSEIPEASVEAVGLNAGDTEKTPMAYPSDDKLDDAIPVVFESESVEEEIDMEAEDSAILDMAQHRVSWGFDYSDGIVTQPLSESTERVEASAGLDLRLWIASGVVVLCIVGALVYGLESGDEGAGPAVVSEDPQASERERVRALIEAPAEPRGVSHTESALERIRANALADDEEELGDTRAGATPAPVPALEVEAPREGAAGPRAASASTQESIGGLEISERGAELVLRLPFEGSLERAGHYELADPPGLAVNLPYATPTAGFQRSLEPANEEIRLVWIRERLGGLHLRVFFEDRVPECRIDFESATVTIQCRR